MKTAIIISGHTRSFKWLFDNQCERVFSQFKEPVFFCSVVEDDQSKDLEVLKDKFGKENVFLEYINAQPDCVELVGTKLFPNASRNYINKWMADAVKKSKYKLAPHATPQTIFASLWHQQRAYELCENSHIKDIGYYVRHRPDLMWTNLEVPATVGWDECYVPWWSSWNGINDRWAVMGRMAASAYFTCFDALPVMLNNGIALHPETLSGHNLNKNLIKVKPLNCEFTAVRVPDADGNCQTIPPNYSVTDIWNLVRSRE